MSEAEEAKLDGAKLQKNSGRGKHSKGDATMEGALCKYVVDYKEYGKGFRVTPEELAKLNADTWRVDKEAVGVLKLILGDRPVRVAVVDWQHFMQLQQELKEYQEESAKMAYVLEQMPVDLADLLEGYGGADE